MKNLPNFCILLLLALAVPVWAGETFGESATFEVDLRGENGPPLFSGLVATVSEGGDEVELAYELSDRNSDACFVTLEFSYDGSEFVSPPPGLEGDLGEGILPGRRVIDWNWQQAFTNERWRAIRVRITADDGNGGSGVAEFHVFDVGKLNLVILFQSGDEGAFRATWFGRAGREYALQRALFPDGPYQDMLVMRGEGINEKLSMDLGMFTEDVNFFRLRATQPEMVTIPAGAFEMGDTFGDGDIREQPVHTVTLSEYQIGKYEVTNGLVADIFNWAIGQGLVTVTSTSLRGAAGNTEEYLDIDAPCSQISWDGTQLVVDEGKREFPCIEISWWGCIGFCNALSQNDGLQACYDLSDGSCNFSRNGWRLPTEAEWEKAARGGVAGQRFPHGDTISHMDANYYGLLTGGYDISRGFHPVPSEGMFPLTMRVGSFAANGYGLHDMAGNVSEWCNDWYNLSYYESSPAANPSGPASGSRRVHRGSNWGHGGDGARCASRIGFVPQGSDDLFGFRLARGLMLIGEAGKP